MPKWRINTPDPGAYVEGIGILKPGSEHDLPEKHIVRRLRDGKPIRVRVRIKPRASWEPLDDAAKELFADHRADLDEIQRKKFDARHEFHKNPSEHGDEEVIEELVASGAEEEPVDEDETVEKAGGAKKSKKQNRASDAP